MHDRGAALLDTADLAERHGIGESGKTIALRHETFESGLRRPRQHHEQQRGQHENSAEENDREYAQAAGKSPQGGPADSTRRRPGGRSGAFDFRGAPHFAARKCGNREQDKNRQVDQETVSGRQHGGRNQFEPRNRLQIAVIASSLRGQQFQDGQEEHHVNRGRQKRPGDVEIIEREETQVGNRQRGDHARRNF